MMNIVNRQISLLIGLIIISLMVLSITACGRKGDLYLPESSAAVKSSPETPEPAEKEKEEKQKKEDSNSAE